MRSIRPLMSSLCLVVVLAFSQSALAKSKPKNATAQCKDGTYSTAKTQQGACSKHGGVQTWYGDAGSPTTVATRTSTKTSVPSGATAQCKDGSYSKAKTQQGACSKHGGVQTWLAGNSTPTPTPEHHDNNVTQSTETHGRQATTRTESSTVTRGNGVPATATAKCRDGSFSFAKQHSGACSHHGGVAEWYR